MTKSVDTKKPSVQKEQSKGHQKKLAKKEAKIMLAIEDVKAELEKAENKLAKARARVDEHTSHLHNLEVELNSVRSTPSENGAAASDSGSDNLQALPTSQELSTSADTPSTVSQNGENHASSPAAVSETTPPETNTIADAPGPNVPGVTDKQANAPAARARTSSTRRSPSTATARSTQTAPARRTTTRQSTNTKPEPETPENTDQ